jgi:hypothetical protein
MKFISTKDMSNEDAPENDVLVKYLEPFFGIWTIEYGIAYFNNPLGYDNPEDGKGWTHSNTGNRLNVIAYCKLPETTVEESPFNGMTQADTIKKYGTGRPNLGNVGK